MGEEKISWGILGPGGIAREFLKGAAGSSTGVVTAIGTRNPDRADLLTNFPGLKLHSGYQSLLADPKIDAIYVATPHPMHAEWVIEAARHGKHVLCEKPLGVRAAEANAMFAAASAHGTFLAEAFMYRLHPLTAKIIELLRQGKVGEIRMIRSSFGFNIPVALPGHRLFTKEVGGGAILDLAGYPMSMARLIAGIDRPEGFADPVDVVAVSRNGATGVEEISAALVTFPNGVIAQLSCSIAQWQDNVLHIMGTAGRLEVDSFWFGSGRYGGTAGMRFVPVQGAVETIELSDERNVYSFQFEAANRAIRDGQTRFAYPGMSEADSIGNARAIDSWIAAAKLCEPPLPLRPVPQS